MKIAIDSYCYHRFFGEVYPQQSAPPRTMTTEDFLNRAKDLNVDGVSLESCFLSSLDVSYLGQLKAQLDQFGLERVFAWGHPDGLEGGANTNAYSEMIACLNAARAIGAKVMRVVGSSLMFRNQPHQPQLERLAAMFREAVKAAEDTGIKLAVENHIDFTASEMLQLLDAVGSPWLGINFDTGNFLRLLDDPLKGMDKVAKYVYATHIKDLKPCRGVAADEWYFLSSTPVGDGLVDNEKLVRKLFDVGYDGLLAVEIDFLHPDYHNDEDAAVAKSVTELKRLAALIDARSVVGRTV